MRAVISDHMGKDSRRNSKTADLQQVEQAESLTGPPVKLSDGSRAKRAWPAGLWACNTRYSAAMMSDAPSRSEAARLGRLPERRVALATLRHAQAIRGIPSNVASPFR
jgi:hypothetical protein